MVETPYGLPGQKYEKIPNTSGDLLIYTTVIQEEDRQKMSEQQVMFMNPQTENLQHLYELVGKLSRQLVENKEKRAHLLRDIDILSHELDKSKAKTRRDNNIPLFKSFLKQRGYGISEVANEAEDLQTLRSQNTLLKHLLQEKVVLNNETLALLRVHEHSLNAVVQFLREDVLEYHRKLVSKCRQLFIQQLVTLEDKEFLEYLQNVSGLQELIDLSEIFRSLLRLHVQM